MVRINGNYEVQVAKTEPNTVFENKQRMESPEPLPLVQQGLDRGALEAQIETNQAEIARLEEAKQQIIVPEEPKKPNPDGTRETVTVEFGETISGLMAKYLCSADDITDLNGNVVKDLQADRKYIIKNTVSPEKRKAYFDACEARTKALSEIAHLDGEIWKVQQAINRDKNIIRSEEIIGQIKSSKNFAHFDERYSFSINPNTGNLCIKLKKELTMSQIKKDFRLADGVIRETNKDESGETILKEFDQGVFATNYNDKIGPVGQVLQLPPFECTPRTR